jgi:uncharacterized protein YecE (DUF72 family)
VSIIIGTSGWEYAHWRGRFYARAALGTDDLTFYADRFQAVEVNGTFYRLPTTETFARWKARVPPDFVFAIKASRYLTHVRRLRDPTEPVQRLLERAQPLGERLGPVLLQLPPNLMLDSDLLAATL